MTLKINYKGYLLRKKLREFLVETKLKLYQDNGWYLQKKKQSLWEVLNQEFVTKLIFYEDKIEVFLDSPKYLEMIKNLFKDFDKKHKIAITINLDDSDNGNQYYY